MLSASFEFVGNYGNPLMIYWPGFNFEFHLDMQRLLPHVAAIEAFRESAANRISPPPWREQPGPDGDAPSSLDLPQDQQSKIAAINQRKYQLLTQNVSRAQDWVRAGFAPGSPALTLQNILTMHLMAAEESGLRYADSGILRTSAVVVGGREVGGIHAGAPAEKLPRLMDEYVAFINSDELSSLPAGIHALVAHFFLTTIHPFADGNGRVCRLVSAAILFQRGYQGHGFYALSGHFYQNDIKYHSLLHQCWQKPLPFDLTRFAAFGLEGLALELQGIRSFVKMKLSRTAEREILTPALRKKKLRRQMLSQCDSAPLLE